MASTFATNLKSSTFHFLSGPNDTSYSIGHEFSPHQTSSIYCTIKHVYHINHLVFHSITRIIHQYMWIATLSQSIIHGIAFHKSCSSCASISPSQSYRISFIHLIEVLTHIHLHNSIHNFCIVAISKISHLCTFVISHSQAILSKTSY